MDESPYVEVARIACEAIARGERARQAVAQHYGCSEGAAGSKMHKARKAGFDIPRDTSAPIVQRLTQDEFIRQFDPMPWKAFAACRDMDPAIFFPGRGEPTRLAKSICAECQVRRACLQYALDNGEKYGVWGGVAEAERRRMRRQIRVEMRAAYQELIA